MAGLSSAGPDRHGGSSPVSSASRPAYVAALALGPVFQCRFHACRGPGATACQQAHIPFITTHSDNTTHRRTAMIAKDLILRKDNHRISAIILRDQITRSAGVPPPPNRAISVTCAADATGVPWITPPGAYLHLGAVQMSCAVGDYSHYEVIGPALVIVSIDS